MTNTSFIRESVQRFFNGALSPAVVERLEALPSRDDARGFLERGFELMKRGGLPPQDLSPFQAELFASIAANLLPGCWGGRVPPITLAGRHARLDQLVKHLCGTSGRMLDIACGFPPRPGPVLPAPGSDHGQLGSPARRLRGQHPAFRDDACEPACRARTAAGQAARGGARSPQALGPSRE
jgi:hypothetical protein